MPDALGDIVVVDLTHVLAGPYCTMVLADLGANVIKIEPPIVGDDSRAFGPFIEEEGKSSKRQSGYFISINRNKRSVCIDLKTPRGLELLREMIKKADVVVENFRPTAMKKLGLSYHELKAINPGIIYCSICGFGHDALPEYSARPAYDLVAQAFSGLMSMTGPAGGPPVRVGSSIGDILAGYQAVIGVLAALKYREKTGEGQHVDISMVDGLVSILENAVARYTIEKEVPAPLGTAHPTITPFQAFMASDKKWIVIPIGNDSLWEKFCLAIGREDLCKNPEYTTNDLRTRHREQLVPIIEQEILKHTAQEWMKILDARGLPFSPINGIDAVVSDPNIRYRNMIVDIDQPKVGKVSITGSPLRLDKTPGMVRTHAPLLGEHTVEILKGFLGYDQEAISKLIRDRIVFTND